MLVKFDVIPDTWEGPEKKLENFVVVVEMLVFALAHYFIFSHKPYVDPAAAQVPFVSACLRMLDVRDVAGDIKEHFVDPIPRPDFRIRRHRQGNHGNDSSSENLPLLKAEDALNNVDSVLLKAEDSVSNGDSPAVRTKAVEYAECSWNHVEVVAVEGQAANTSQHHLSETSYDDIGSKEQDDRTECGHPGEMIADNATRMDNIEGTHTSFSRKRMLSSSSLSTISTSDSVK